MDDDSQRAAAHDHNRRVWNHLVRDRQRFTLPARDDDFANPLRTLDGLGWLRGGVRGRRVLCLAAGGGRHGPLYAAAGAITTVVDISPAMLEHDRQVATERRLSLRTVEASMDDLSMFEPGEFDIVVQPVSTCYTPDIEAVYRQVAYVVRPEGTYISQHKQPASLQADVAPSLRGYELIEPYYRSGSLPPVVGSPLREEGTLEYLHRWEQLIGGMCRAGFAVEDLIEPRHADEHAERGSFPHRCRYLAPYVRILARRVRSAEVPLIAKKLWTPG